MSLGFVAFCLLKSRWRLIGLVPVLGSQVALFFVAAPDLLIAGDAKLMAIKDTAGVYRLLCEIQKG